MPSAPITIEFVQLVAKQVFPGLTDEHIRIRNPNQGTDWSVAISFTGNGSVGLDVSHTSFAAGSITGASSPLLVCVPDTSLTTEDDLRNFLEACRDSLMKHLMTLLELAIGPVHVLLVDKEFERERVIDFLRERGASPLLSSIGAFLLDYELALLARRAKSETDKPPG